MRIIWLLALLLISIGAWAQPGPPPNGPPTAIYGGSGSLDALVYSNSLGTPVRIDIFPDATNKPDEGNAAVRGTVAWANAQLTGGEIDVEAGAYTIGTIITLSTAGTSLVCANYQTTTFTPSSGFNSTMIKLGWAGAQRIGMQVRNCGFLGNSGGVTSGTSLWVRDTAYAVVQGNYFYFSKNNALIIDATVGGAVNNSVTDNKFYECYQECVVLNGAANNATDSYFTNNTFGGSGALGDSAHPYITVNGVGSLQFIGNHMYGQLHTQCINFAGASLAVQMIIGNEFDHCPQDGLELNTISSSTISGNSFYGGGAASSGTYTDINLGTGTNNTITGNNFQALTTAKNAVASGNGASGNIITGNQFIGYSGYAISLLNSFAGNNTIGSNNYVDNAGNVTLGSTYYFPTTVPMVTTPSLAQNAVPGTIGANSITMSQLASGPTPSISTQGTAGSSTWTYVIVPLDANGNAAPAGTGASTTTGNATLTSGNYNVIQWASVSGAYSYNVYRTAHGTSPSTNGKIGNVLATAINATSNYQNFLNDTGLAGDSTTAPTINTTGGIAAYNYQTASICGSHATPAACGSAAAGAVAVPTGTNPTLVVDTTAVTANSQIFLNPDETLGTATGATCNTTITTQAPIVVTARTAGTSFTIEVDATVATNPVCVSYHIIN